VWGFWIRVSKYDNAIPASWRNLEVLLSLSSTRLLWTLGFETYFASGNNGVSMTNRREQEQTRASKYLQMHGVSQNTEHRLGTIRLVTYTP
jgi:hypothetical protein